jgi:hypothetical protein
VLGEDRREGLGDCAIIVDDQNSARDKGAFHREAS